MREKAESAEDLLAEQMEYYRARAGEYDEWFLREGRYDRGAELRRQWFDEVAEVVAALDAFRPTGHVLELAAGTGLWTQHLARYASSITVVDSSAEMLELNRQRMRNPSVEYVQADLFSWQPNARYDVVFFGFWLSHVPPGKFGGFWNLVRSCLAHGGRVFFVDSRYEPSSTAVDHRLQRPEAMSVRRRLNDGREFTVVKVFYEAEELQHRLSTLGWRLTVRETIRYFLYGCGALAKEQASAGEPRPEPARVEFYT